MYESMHIMSQCMLHALAHNNQIRYLSIDADDSLPRGGAMFKLNAVDSVAQGHFPHADQVVRHPGRSSVTDRRTGRGESDINPGRPGLPHTSTGLPHTSTGLPHTSTGLHGAIGRSTVHHTHPTQRGEPILQIGSHPCCQIGREIRPNLATQPVKLARMRCNTCSGL